MSNPEMWIIVFREEDGTLRESRHYGTITPLPTRDWIEIVHYSGGVGGFPRPMDTRVVPRERIAEWRSDR